jgi:hypothetical protein
MIPNPKSRSAGKKGKQTANSEAQPATKPEPVRPVGPTHKSSTKAGCIRVGIGGWTFEPWREVFYPAGLAHAQELAYAAARVTSIEVNGTFYRTQKPATFRDWASEVPAGFVFSVKGPRYAVNRRVLREAEDSIKRFFDSGVTELGDHLGPLLWQFAPTKKFDPTDFAGFLELLPKKFDGRALRHVIEVRHDSFRLFTPITCGIRTLPTSPAISFMPGYNAARTRSRPPIRRRRSTPGRGGCDPGRRAASRTICPAWHRCRGPNPRRATSSLM